jgi:hydroxymethylpyrimidine/phosphomethylpyrimidine kinase
MVKTIGKDMPFILSIGGSDSSSIAGIQMDIKVALMLNTYCLSVVTAVTAQNTSRVDYIKPMDASIVKAQLDTLLDDFTIDAIKVGMLYTKENINVVSNTLDNYISSNYSKPIVADPILVSSTGTRLLEHDAMHEYVKRIIPLASVVTPNILEAEWLSSMSISSIEDAKIAAERIADLGAKSVIIKGGHLMHGYDATDVILHEGKIYTMHSYRVQGIDARGLGSIYSTALTVELAKGNDLLTAASVAKSIAYNALLKSIKAGKGMNVPLLREYKCDDKIIKELSRAVDVLISTDSIGMLIPESQSNLVFAKENAKSNDDVAAVEGRIVRVGDKASIAGRIAYSASRHVADAVLTAMRYDNSIRSAMNITYDSKIIEACKRLNMSISSYDRSKEPIEIKAKEGMSIRWGIDHAIRAFNYMVPDIVYHEGDIGKEPMIIVFGKDPMHVVTKVKAILELIIKWKGSDEYNEGRG